MLNMMTTKTVSRTEVGQLQLGTVFDSPNIEFRVSDAWGYRNRGTPAHRIILFNWMFYDVRRAFPNEVGFITTKLALQSGLNRELTTGIIFDFWAVNQDVI